MLKDTHQSRRQYDPQADQTTAEVVLKQDIQFGYHSASGKHVKITNDGLRAKKMDVLGNGVACGAQPLKGVAEFEVKIVSHRSGLHFGVMRCKKNAPVKSGHNFPHISFAVLNHCIWADQRLCNNLVTPSKLSAYGSIDLEDLREGDYVGLRLSEDGVLEFTVNSESQGIAAKNVYARDSDIYAVVDHYGNHAATAITKAGECTCSAWLRGRGHVP